MEESIKDKIKVLQAGAADQEEFMKQLADVDENGQLTDDMLDAVNGGVGPGLLIEPIGLMTPDQDGSLR